TATTSGSTTGTETATTSGSTTGTETATTSGSTTGTATTSETTTTTETATTSGTTTTTETTTGTETSTATPTATPKCAPEANQVNAQLNTLLTNIQSLITARPSLSPGLDPITALIRQVQANLTQVSTLPLADLASTANAAQQASTLALLIARSAVNGTSAATPVVTTITQLLPLIQTLLTCTGPAAGCDNYISLYNQIVPLVRAELQSLNATFPTPILFNFITQSFDNATAAFQQGLLTANVTGLGLPFQQLAFIANATRPAVLGGNIAPNDAVAAVLTAASVALQCLGANTPLNNCRDGMLLLGTLVQYLESNLSGWLNQVPVLGPVVLPVATSAFDQIKNNLTTGDATLFHDAGSNLEGVLQFLTSIVVPSIPEPAKTQITDLSQALLDVTQNTATACNVTLTPCQGLIAFGADFLRGAVNQLRNIPGVGTLGAPFFNAADTFIGILERGDTAAIQAGLVVFNAALATFALVPGVNTNPLFKAIQSLSAQLTTCTGAPTPVEP
ncbi:hypothetical protein DFQ26_000787, partial [Actinomortierella ambigua]